MSRRGLGRGLGVLIPGGDDSPAGLQEVGLDEIVPNPHQPRMTFGDKDVVELAESIKEHGVIQPLVVNRMPEGGYQLIAGERRWRASRLAGLERVPVVIKDVAPQQMLEIALVENVQRADLNAIEEALAYRQLVDEFNLSQAEVARRVGKSRVAITNTMRLLQAAAVVQDALVAAQISEGHARAILGLPEFDDQATVLRFVIDQKLTVRETEAVVKKVKAGELSATKEKAKGSPEVRALEERFQESLGTRVRLKAGRKGGRLVIYYYSDEEFQSLYQRLTGDDL